MDAWVASSQQAQRDITAVINDNLHFLKFAAASVPIFIPQLPLSAFDPTELSRMFRAYDDASIYTFTSLGIIRKAPNTTNGKLSWQLAQGFGCTPYIYAYSDAQINPAFDGFCADVNGQYNDSNPVYMGLDWGLKPEEELLLSGHMPYTFLPIFNLLSQFTLTYEMVGWATGLLMTNTTPVLGVSFAEMDLRVFSAYVANNITGNAYVMETQTTGMIASTLNNSVVNATLARQFANTSTFPLISQTFAFALANPGGVVDGYTNGWRVTASRYQDTGLDWTVVVVIPNSQIYDGLEYSIIVASVISFGIILIAIGVIVLLNVCCIRKSFMYLARRLNGDNAEGSHFFTEFRDLDSKVPLA